VAAALSAAAIGVCAAQSTPRVAQAAPTKPAASAPAGGALSGKIVWVDLKNSALLVECESNDACKSVGGKKGETYTLTIPEKMKGTAASWKEGGMVKILFEDRPDGARALKSVSSP
jgi:hypothetical protein